MPVWSFQLRLNRMPTEADVDALFEAGLDDASVADTVVDVDREAPTLLAAVTSAASDVRKVSDLRPVGATCDDAVTLRDAAARLRGTRSAESLRLLAEGKRGPGGFPLPIVDTGNIRVWSWAEVSSWLRDAVGDDVPGADPDLVLADAALRLVDRAERIDTAHVDAIRHLIGA